MRFPLVGLAVILGFGAGDAEPTVSPVQPPGRIRVFTYSRDSLAGFKDGRLDSFRRELGEFGAAFMEVAYSPEEAHARVQFLGQGDLSVEIGSETEPERHVWTPNAKAPCMWAVVRVGDHTKEFSVEGNGMRDLSRLAKDIAGWLEGNTAAIREKAFAN